MSPVLLTMLKKFLPEIQKAALPAITSITNECVKSVTLEEGEESACIMLSNYKGDWWAFVVAMSPDNQVTRICKQMKLEELLSTGLAMIDKVC